MYSRLPDNRSFCNHPHRAHNCDPRHCRANTRGLPSERIDSHRSSEAPMFRLALLFSVALLFQAPLSAQQKVAQPSYAAIPVDAAKQSNPVKSSPESIARAKKRWSMDCAMCHGKDGNGKGDVAADMKLKIADFTNPDTLKDRTDGEIFY